MWCYYSLFLPHKCIYIMKIFYFKFVIIWNITFRYLTYTEWSTLYGGRKSGTTLETSEEKTFRRLPYDHCCLSLQPFEHPYCDPHGNVFELEAILAYLKQYKHNPITGKSLDAKSLIKLKFHKNVQDEYQCPVLFKLFTKHSHIVAIKTTGNVFSYEVSIYI